MIAISLKGQNTISTDSVVFFQSPKIEGYKGVDYIVRCDTIDTWHDKTIDLNVELKNGVIQVFTFKCFENGESHNQSFQLESTNGSFRFSIFFHIYPSGDLAVSFGGMNFFNVCSITTTVKFLETELITNPINTSNCE